MEHKYAVMELDRPGPGKSEVAHRPMSAYHVADPWTGDYSIRRAKISLKGLMENQKALGIEARRRSETTDVLRGRQRKKKVLILNKKDIRKSTMRSEVETGKSWSN